MKSNPNGRLNRISVVRQILNSAAFFQSIIVVISLQLNAISDFDTLKKASSNKQVERIKLIYTNNRMLLKCYLNGRKGYFLVDTGASHSVLNSKNSKSFNFTVIKGVHKNSDKRSRIGLLSSSTGIVVDAKLNFGSINIVRGFFSHNLTALSGQISYETGYKILGVLGSDILKLFQAKLDIGKAELKFLK